MSMLQKNSLPIGLMVGLLFPLFGFSLVFGVFDLLTSSGLMDEAAMGFKSKRMRTMTLIGICANIYWIKRFNQPFTSQTLRGAIIGTMLLSLAWFITYYSDLYSAE